MSIAGGAPGTARDGYRAAAPAEPTGELREQVRDPAETLRRVLRIHHPIMRSETGPLSGCRCGMVRLGQDVIQHVVTELTAAVNQRAAEELRAAAGELVKDGRPDLTTIDQVQAVNDAAAWLDDRADALDPT